MALDFVKEMILIVCSSEKQIILNIFPINWVSRQSARASCMPADTMGTPQWGLRLHIGW